MSQLITHIGELTTNTERGRIRGAALVIDDGVVAWIGEPFDAPAADTRIDAGGRALLPGWVDSHSHIVFDGDREGEFEARMAGQPYAAGGIATTVSATRAATSERLMGRAITLRSEALRQGTTTLETKTGYGLDVETERRIAQVASRAVEAVTFLGAHVVPAGVDRRDYLDQVTGPMLEAVLPYVSAIDVFCESGAFDAEESREVLLAGRAAGLDLHVHGNQLGQGPGALLAVELDALSVDHATHLSDADIDSLGASRTVATVLPACDLSTRQPLAPARRLLDAGATVAMATNCNPGSSFTTSMPFCIATAVLQMGLSVEEAVFAATRGGALALGAGRELGPSRTGATRIRKGRGIHPGTGTIDIGVPADLQLLDAPSVAYLAYRPGIAWQPDVWRGGRRVA